MHVGTNFGSEYQLVHFASYLNYFDVQDIRHVVLPFVTEMIIAYRLQLFVSSELSGEAFDVLVICKGPSDMTEKQVLILVGSWHKVVEFIKRKPEVAATSAKHLGISDAGLLSSPQGLKVPTCSMGEDVMLNRKLKGTENKLNHIMLENRLFGYGKIAVYDLINRGYL